jgi:hypothetical protein
MENTKSQVRIQSDLSDPITAKKGLRQGDSLACLLFNLALEKVVRDTGIQINGTIFYKSAQLLAYANDIDIIARSPTALKKAFLSLKRAAGVMGLKINEKRAKYMTSRTNTNQSSFELKNLFLKLYRVLHIWAVFWMLTTIIPLKLEKEFYWLTSAFMD